MTQSYAARDWRSRSFRYHTLHLGPNRSQRRSHEFQGRHRGENVTANTPYHNDGQGNLVPGVK